MSLLAAFLNYHHYKDFYYVSTHHEVYNSRENRDCKRFITTGSKVGGKWLLELAVMVFTAGS